MKRFLGVLAIVLWASVAFAQSDVVVPNESLVTEGIPKIPASLAQDVGRYSEFRAAFFASWNPERREMLIATRFADTNQTHLVKFPGGARTQLTFFPDSAGPVGYQPVNGNSFAFLKDIGGNEFFQLYRYDLDTGEITLLTDGKSRNTGRIKGIALLSVPRDAPETMWTSGWSAPRIRAVRTWSRRLRAADGKFPTGRPTANNCWPRMESPRQRAMCGWWTRLLGKKNC
jgi:hypothetical protein